jgi:hypothetical protein
VLAQAITDRAFCCACLLRRQRSSARCCPSQESSCRCGQGGSWALTALACCSTAVRLRTGVEQQKHALCVLQQLMRGMII